MEKKEKPKLDEKDFLVDRCDICGEPDVMANKENICLDCWSSKIDKVCDTAREVGL